MSWLPLVIADSNFAKVLKGTVSQDERSNRKQVPIDNIRVYTLPSYAMKVHFLRSNLVNLSYSYALAISVFINNKMFNLVILKEGFSVKR